MTLHRLPVIDAEDQATIEQLRKVSPETADEYERLAREQAELEAREPVADHDGEAERDRWHLQGYQTGGGRRRREPIDPAG